MSKLRWSTMPPTIRRATVNSEWFNPDLSWLPYNLQRHDFENTMREIYDFMYELDTKAVEKGWQRLDDILPAQTLSGMTSALVKVSLAKFSRSLIGNRLENGFPDLIPLGMYAGNSIADGEGVEVKSTNKLGGGVDMHSAHGGWFCTFTYEIDIDEDAPITQRSPFHFTEVFCGRVFPADYRLNGRGQRGTRTATLDATGLSHYRKFWVYADDAARRRQWFRNVGHLTPDLERVPLHELEYDETWYQGPNA